MVGSFLQTGAGRPSQKIPNYGSGRICGMAHCDTVLSAYNPAVFCSLHDAAAVPRRRSVVRNTVK